MVDQARLRGLRAPQRLDAQLLDAQVVARAQLPNGRGGGLLHELLVRGGRTRATRGAAAVRSAGREPRERRRGRDRAVALGFGSAFAFTAALGFGSAFTFTAALGFGSAFTFTAALGFGSAARADAASSFTFAFTFTAAAAPRAVAVRTAAAC